MILHIDSRCVATSRCIYFRNWTQKMKSRNDSPQEDNGARIVGGDEAWMLDRPILPMFSSSMI